MNFINILAFVLVLFSGVAFAQAHHHPGHHTSHRAAVKAGQTFVATEDLKVRMEKIIKLSENLNEQSAEPVAEVVKDIFKTCKLEPQADEAVHPILAKILSGAQDLKAKDVKKGTQKIKESIRQYQKLFR